MKRLKFKSFALTATSTRAPLDASTPKIWAKQVIIQNLDTTNAVFLGDIAVLDTTGFKIAALGGGFGLDSNINPAKEVREICLNDLYVICSSAQTATLRIGYLYESDV